MKTTTLVACAMALTGCEDRKTSSVVASTFTFDDHMEAWDQGRVERSKRELAAKARHETVAALRKDLAVDWTSLAVACRYDCSCTGTSISGFKIVREKEAFTVAPWFAVGGETESESAGSPHPLSKSAAEQLLSETALYFLAATLSVNPLEKVARAPQDNAKLAEWRKKYSDAGGPPMAGDNYSIEVRISTLNGVKKYSDRFDDDNVRMDFGRWVAAFGNVKTPP